MERHVGPSEANDSSGLVPTPVSFRAVVPESPACPRGAGSLGNGVGGEGVVLGTGVQRTDDELQRDSQGDGLPALWAR